MTDLYREYESTSSNPRPCYSNLKCYGNGGRYLPIVPPTPVTTQPWMFNIMTPHNMGPQPHMKAVMGSSQSESDCLPYRTLDSTCRKCWS